MAALAIVIAGCAAAIPSATPAATSAAPAVTSAAPSATAPAATGERASVRAGIIEGNIAYAPFYIAQDRGYFTDQNLAVELVGFASGNDMIPPLATNELQAGGVAPGPPFYNALNRGIDFVIVGDTSSQATGGQAGQGLVVRKALVDSGEYKGYESLRGRKVAVPTRFAANEFNLRKALALGGLTVDDIEIVAMGYPDMSAAMSTGAVDAGISTEPLITVGVEQGIFVRVAGADEFYPDHQIGGLTFNAEFAKTDVAKRFYLGFIKGTRDYNDAFFKNTGRDEMVQLLARVTTLKDPALYAKVRFTGLDPNGRVKVQSLQDNFAILKAEGIVEGEVDFSKIVDTSFSEYAIAQLGEYK